MNYTTLIFFILTACTGMSDAGKKHLATAKVNSLHAGIDADSLKKEPSPVYYSGDQGRSWKPGTGIPAPATVSAFLCLPDKIYAATDHHGIFICDSKGLHWSAIGARLPQDINMNAISLAGATFILGTQNHGVYISRDSCQNWQSAKVSLKHTAIRCLLSLKNSVLAGTDEGIYRSPDQGDSWEQVYAGGQVNGFTELHGKIYAALANGAMISKDAGSNWTYIYRPHTLHDISQDGEYVYAMTLGSGLLRTHNDGLNWESIDRGLGNLYTFEIQGTQANLLAAQWQGLYQYDRITLNWQRISLGLPDSTAFTTLEETAEGFVAGIGLRKK